jgi:nucleotide-binding universal stress UspA family protein
MYQRILVAVDGSEPSNRALSEARRLAAEHRSRLRLIHIVDTSCLYHGDENDRSGEIEEAWCLAAERLLEEARGRVASSDVEVETAICCSHRKRISEEIVENARQWGADLIVLGTHGRRGLNRLLLGSVAEGVIRISPVSVLLALNAS